MPPTRSRTKSRAFFADGSLVGVRSVCAKAFIPSAVTAVAAALDGFF